MKYDWSDFPFCKEYLERIEQSTKRNIDRDYSNMAQEYVDDLEDFIVQGIKVGFITKDNFKDVIERMNQLDSINVLPKNMRWAYGETINGQVLVNPDMERNKRKLYMFHEIAHVAIGIDENILDENWKLYEEHRKETENPIRGDLRFGRLGWRVLEEGLVQNIAEELMASYLNKNREEYDTRRDRAIPGIQFESNYDHYGLFQPLVTAFGRTLRGVGESQRDTDEKILKELSAKAFDKEFSLDIIKEYKNDVGLDKLYSVLSNFGVVFSEDWYHMTGKGLGTAEKSSTEHYQDALQQMAELEDYRQVNMNDIQGRNNTLFENQNRININIQRNNERDISHNNEYINNGLTLSQKVALIFQRRKFLMQLPFIEKYVNKQLNILPSSETTRTPIQSGKEKKEAFQKYLRNSGKNMSEEEKRLAEEYSKEMARSINKHINEVISRQQNDRNSGR